MIELLKYLSLWVFDQAWGEVDIGQVFLFVYGLTRSRSINTQKEIKVYTQQVQEKSISTPWTVFGNVRGWVVWKAYVLKESMQLNWLSSRGQWGWVGVKRGENSIGEYGWVITYCTPCLTRGLDLLQWNTHVKLSVEHNMVHFPKKTLIRLKFVTVVLFQPLKWSRPTSSMIPQTTVLSLWHRTLLEWGLTCKSYKKLL